MLPKLIPDQCCSVFKQEIKTIGCVNVKGLFKRNEIYPIADIRTDIITVRNEVAKVMFLQVSVCPQ